MTNMEDMYSVDILHILRESKVVKTVYKRISEKIMAMPRKERLTLKIDWVISTFDYEIKDANLNEEQLQLLARFKSIYIGVFVSTNIETADRIAKSLLTNPDN